MSSSHWIAVILIGLLVVANVPFVYFSKKKRADTASLQARNNLRRSTERRTTHRPRSVTGTSLWRSDPPIEASEQEAVFAQTTASSDTRSDE